MPTDAQYAEYDKLLDIASTNGLRWEVMEAALSDLLVDHPESVIQRLQQALYDWYI